MPGKGSAQAAIARPESGKRLVLRRTYDAPVEDVFGAWTEPAQLREWFAPPLGGSAVSVEIDLRVGGRIEIAFKPFLRWPGSARVPRVGGEFIEIERPSRVVLTLEFEGVPARLKGPTMVTLEFLDREGQTELVLTHEGQRGAGERAFHRAGWRWMLPRLGRTLSRRRLSEG